MIYYPHKEVYTLDERIRKLRRYFDLTQQEFAEKVGTTRNNIAGYETGKRLPSVAVVSAICDKCNVNEQWLRTGEGTMFAPEIEDALGVFIRERNLTSTDRILIEKFVSLSTKARQAVVSYVLGIADALWEECKESVQQRTGQGTSEQERTQEDIGGQEQVQPDIEAQARTEAEEFYRQRLLEKSQTVASSALPSDIGDDAKSEMA